MVHRILSDLSYFFTELPQNILWSYGIFDRSLEVLSLQIPNLILIENLPSQEYLEKICDGENHQILVCDDTMMELKANYKFTVNLATRFARHRKLTIFVINQNFFELPRTFNLNTRHLLLCHPGRDFLSMTNLSHQLFPKKKSILVKIWRDIEENNPNYPYLLINCGNNVQKEYKLLTCIFRGEDTISYIVNEH